MAARKQKSKGFNKFLDLIGLVDSADTGRDDDFDADFDTGRVRGRSAAKNNGASDDEFFDEPRMSRAQPRRERPAQNAASSAGSRFDADEGWGDTASASARPEYGARTQQRAQSGARPSSGRYGGAQNARSNGRYEGGQAADNGYYRSGSYQTDGYQSGSYRANAAYGGYGASRRNESEAVAHYGNGAVQERNQGGQRHQTAIFKLHSVDECKGVILALIDKKSVLLNMEDLDSLQAQRTLDTMSGATFAIGAKLSRASDRTWLITPSTVEVDDGQNEPGGSYGKRYM